MVHHHRASLLVHQQQQRKGDPGEPLPQEGGGGRMKELRGRLADYACHHRKHGHDALLRMLAGFALVSCLLLLLPGSPVSAAMDELLQLGRRMRHDEEATPVPPCADVANGTVCCDRTALRTDVCVMRGDVRTEAASNSLFLLVRPNSSAAAADERIRPYTRKWESSIMSTIDELRLRAVPEGATAAPGHCDVRHEVPAVVFSTGGYTGNVYHEFNDGIIPLYITARQYNKKVVFVMLEYHDWWMTKYGHIVEQLSDYPPIDFANDRRTHCFQEAVVGLRIHDELAIDTARMTGNQSIQDFRQMLDDAYRGRVQTIIEEEEKEAAEAAARKQHHRGSKRSRRTKTVEDDKPRLVIVSRNGSRAIENEAELVRAAAGAGFRVDVLQPRQDTELAKMYRALNASDVMVGVHGAAMTHFLFMRPGSVFIQVVPLGTDWAAETYYGEPARRLGLRYMPYKILPSESSLYGQYAKDDTVLTDPDTVNAKGWQVTKKVYLDGQNVRLDMARFRRRLREAYGHWAEQRQRHRVDSGMEQRRPL
ncbi:xylan glycosyltransferase MUCI21-like [Phragmites australis]|uniref:xylan glycosyltransferase MUCI21-like n=1 Tax=Phragmites australis TaxID=29695 RepID=UPI002D775290|nr:xylan glycosyltransferase MUCI21-like [Phragmites australis]